MPHCIKREGSLESVQKRAATDERLMELELQGTANRTGHAQSNARGPGITDDEKILPSLRLKVNKELNYGIKE